jgi:ABC-type antimicrobial peptide transport system permease subunit
VDPDQAIADVKTIGRLEQEDLATDRLRSILMVAFALTAVALTMIGLYAVVAQGVVQRTREIGIRAALGADARRLLRLVLGQGLALIGLGLALGVAGAIAALRVLRAFLFGVAPTDPSTLAGAAAIMTCVAAAACYLPARHAARVDPLTALKSE